MHVADQFIQQKPHNKGVPLMGPGRRYEKNAAGFVLFFIFVVVMALASSCQRSTRAEVSANTGQLDAVELLDESSFFH